MNIPGRTIQKAEVLITDPFPRGGDGMFLRAQLLAITGTQDAGLTIDVYTRNAEDNSGWNAITGATLLMDAGVGDIFELHVPPSADANEGIEEQLRLNITGDADAAFTIRIFPPLFYDAAIGDIA